MAMRLGLTTQSRPIAQAIKSQIRSLSLVGSQSFPRAIAQQTVNPVFGTTMHSMEQAKRGATKTAAAAVRYAYGMLWENAWYAQDTSTQLHNPPPILKSSAESDRKLQTPHGNNLVDLMLPEDQKQAAIDACTKELDLSDRNACDVELLVVGYVRVCCYMFFFKSHTYMHANTHMISS